MKRNITAILLVFALLAGFASCKKLPEAEITIESKAYIVDDAGVTHVVEKDDNDYFYFDSNGNKVIVKSKDVVVETQQVTESTTLSPEAQSFFDAFNDPEKFEEMLETDLPAPELEFGEDPIPDDGFNKVDVELNEEGRPDRSDMENNFMEIVESEKFTMDFTVKSNTNGEEMIIPIVASRDGDNLAFELVIPTEKGSMRYNFILSDQCYVVIPAMRAYMPMPKEVLGDMIPGDVFSEELAESEFTAEYVESGEVEYEGKTYSCDVYKDGDAVTKYYYSDNELKRIETVSGENGENVTIVEINSISDKVDSSKFKVSKNYLNLATVMGDEFNPYNLT